MLFIDTQNRFFFFKAELKLIEMAVVIIQASIRNCEIPA